MSMGWFDEPYTQSEAEEAASRLHAARADDPEMRVKPLTVEDTHQQIDRDRLDRELKAWLKATASWGGESRDLAVAYGKRAKEAGLIS